jgi:hypothetical protein
VVVALVGMVEMMVVEEEEVVEVEVPMAQVAAQKR